MPAPSTGYYVEPKDMSIIGRVYSLFDVFSNFMLELFHSKSFDYS